MDQNSMLVFYCNGKLVETFIIQLCLIVMWTSCDLQCSFWFIAQYLYLKELTFNVIHITRRSSYLTSLRLLFVGRFRILIRKSYLQSTKQLKSSCNTLCLLILIRYQNYFSAFHLSRLLHLHRWFSILSWDVATIKTNKPYQRCQRSCVVNNAGHMLFVELIRAQINW